MSRFQAGPHLPEGTCTNILRMMIAVMMHGPGQANMLRAKQQLLALLLERVRDQTSYTRKQVLASWHLLAEHAKIPISHWVPVAELAIGEPHLAT